MLDFLRRMAEIGRHKSVMQTALDEFWEYELDQAIDESIELKNAFNEEMFDDAKACLEAELKEFNDKFCVGQSPCFSRVESIDLRARLKVMLKGGSGRSQSRYVERSSRLLSPMKMQQ
ncbi:MAG: hypothetical protein IPG64_10760 [Haliea sp.]|nr:hypothetical protein [Haliea sp.]